MFGIFSRKQQVAANLQSDAMVVDSEAPKQLRTPSPSEVASNGLGPAAKANIGPTPGPDAPTPAIPPTPEALHALVTSIPPKTLHAYVLAQIPACAPDTLAALAAFFATAKPPPLLHCVRCHADYTEVENGERSCRVPHDDDSAEIEWVGRSGKYNSEYETYWDCCGKTVEGEGDLGPPDGWCYEGMHTVSRPCLTFSPRAFPPFPAPWKPHTKYLFIPAALQPDIKRARFRADSTNSDDKLVSCLELNCRNTRARLPSISASSSVRAKRARPPPAEDDDVGHDYDDCGSVGTEGTGVAEIAHGVGEPGQKRKGNKYKPIGSTNSKGKGRAKPKAAADAATATATSTPARTRVRMQVPAEPDTGAGSNKNAGSAGAPAARAPASRRRRRSDANAKPRSAASSGSKATSPPASPPSRGRKPLSKMDSVEIVLRSRSSTRSRVRGGGADTGDEKTMTDAEGKARKRRRVAAPAA